MKIVHAVMHQVRLDLRHSFETSSHRKDHIEHILVRLESADGAIGWGEIAAPADPYYCPDTTETSWHVARSYLLPALLGLEWDQPQEVPGIWARIRGHEFAKAGVDMALWTLWATARGLSLSSALGGSRTEIEAGVSLGIEPTLDSLLSTISTHTQLGYRRVKLKIRPGWDLEPVRAARSAFPGLDLQVDANGAYPGTTEALATLQSLDAFGLLMIEQPFAPRDLLTHAALQRTIGTPVCLDESLVTLDDIRTMVALGAGRVVNIKVSRIGGLTAARAAHDLCREEGLPAWCGGMHEFGIGRLANVAISSLPGFTLPSDVSASAKYYTRDVVDPEVAAHDGRVSVPLAPGLGHRVDEEWIARNTVRSAELPAPAAA